LWFLWFDIPLFVVRQHNRLNYTFGKNSKFIVANKSGEGVKHSLKRVELEVEVWLD